MNIKKCLGGLLIVLLLAALTVILTTDFLDEYVHPEPTWSTGDQLGPLVMQKSNLLKQMDRIQQEYISRIQGMGTVTLLFTQPDAVFMDIVVPITEKSGIVGVVAFGPDKYPGQEGCITLEQWKQLEQAGWEICLLWDGSTHLSRFMDQMNNLLASIGIAPSLSVYVPEDLFDLDLLVAARQLNLKALVHKSTQVDVQNQIQSNDVWLPKGMAWHLDNTSALVEAIVSDGGSVVLEVYNEIVWDGGYRRLFRSMLETLTGWQEENKMRIATINQSIAYRQGVLLGSMELEAEMRTHLESLSLQIEELDTQINGFTD